MQITKGNTNRIIAGSILVALYMVLIFHPSPWSDRIALFLGLSLPIYIVYLAYQILIDSDGGSKHTFEDKFYEDGSFRSGVNPGADIENSELK